MTTYALTRDGVTRLEDNAAIPNDPANIDWAIYQQWLIEGGVPRPLQPGAQYDWNGSAWIVNAQRQALIDALAALGIDLSAVKADAAIVTFLKMSPAQIDAYLAANITGANVASVNAIRTVLAVVGKVVAVMARAQIANPP